MDMAKACTRREEALKEGDASGARLGVPPNARVEESGGGTDNATDAAKPTSG